MSDFVVLAPGPTFVNYKRENHPDAITIAINTASRHVACDYLCMLDFDGWTSIINPDGTPQVLGKPTIIQGITAHGNMCAAYPFSRDYAWWNLDDYQHVFPNWIDWSAYSFTASLIAAWQLGSTVANNSTTYCYGADFAGSADWDGVVYGGRDTRRWEREHRIFDNIVALMKTMGESGSRITRVGY